MGVERREGVQLGGERGWNKLCEWAEGKEEEGRGHTHMEGVMKVNELLSGNEGVPSIAEWMSKVGCC